jgi:PAS domain S-box-containing protein
MEKTENSLYLSAAKLFMTHSTDKHELTENIPSLKTHQTHVTDLHRHELPQRELFLQTVLSHAPIILFALDSSGIFKLSEGRGLQALGVQAGEVVGASIFEIYRGFPNIIESVCRCLNGEATTSTNQISGRVFETLFTPLRDADGQVTGIIGVATDISERVGAETALRVNEERFRALSEYASDHALGILKRLFDLGIHISIDDFGTGYSSLAYLKRLPVDELKIDRSFVQHLAQADVDKTIVHSTINMAHSLGLRVVAEGVEDVATWHLLASLGCDTAQGYFMSRPLPPQDLERLIRKTKYVLAY